MRRPTIPTLKGSGERRGFTLVELLVAIAITAIISVAIFGIFDSTSDALYEADSLANSVDSARFTLEKVRTDLKQAGAFGTPDSATDPQVRPEPGDLTRGGTTNTIADYRLAGLVSYGGGNGWQDYANDVMPDDVFDENTDGDLEPQFDGIIVMGAYDYPFMFEVGDLTGTSVQVYDHPRGLDKLERRNVFKLERPTTAFGGSNPTDVVDAATTKRRVIRLRDPNGFYQFAGISSLEDTGGLTINFETVSGASAPVFVKPSGAQDLPYGFPPRAQRSQGERYYASLIDAYWYHVIQDPANPKNFQLVRQRLDAYDLMTSDEMTGNWNELDPSTHVPDALDGNYTVIAERVVDFQVWFDCTESVDGTITNLEWTAGWNPPDGTTKKTNNPHHGCLNPSSATGGDDQPETSKVRMGHVRLSIRTENERADLQHNPFPDNKGTSRDNQQLETFDIDPDQPGATRVYTTQADFELTNYAVRNITP